MNQKNGKNSLGLDSIFEDLDNPIDLFKNWFKKAEESEINDANALALGTADQKKQPASIYVFSLEELEKTSSCYR